MSIIVSSPSYSMKDLRKLPSKIWKDFPDVKNKTVFIKPNLVSPPTKCDAASCTNINIVRLVIEKCMEGKASLVRVGDCGFKNQWDLTMELSHYPSLVNRYGIELIPLQDGENFHKFSLIRFENKSDYLSLYGAKISDYVLECDVVINIPKLKMHTMAYITGAIKNMMGTMTQKGSMHPRASHAILHKRLRDFYMLLKDRVHWCLMDGVVGSAYSEQYGLPMKSDILISDSDMWAMDCTAAQAMGVIPSEVPYLRYIHKAIGRDWPGKIPMKFIRQYERPLAWRKE